MSPLCFCVQLGEKKSVLSEFFGGKVHSVFEDLMELDGRNLLQDFGVVGVGQPELKFHGRIQVVFDFFQPDFGGFVAVVVAAAAFLVP